jgi:hypothetical protein
MCGRTQHPTPEMLDHARALLHMQSCRDMIDRLGLEINDRQQMRAQAKRTLAQLLHSQKRRTAA